VEWLNELLPPNVFEKASDVDTFQSINNIFALLEHKEMKPLVSRVFVSCFELSLLRTTELNLKITRDNAAIEGFSSTVQNIDKEIMVNIIRYLWINI